MFLFPTRTNGQLMWMITVNLRYDTSLETNTQVAFKSLNIHTYLLYSTRQRVFGILDKLVSVKYHL